MAECHRISHFSNLNVSMNSMYYVQQTKFTQDRFIRMSEQCYGNSYRNSLDASRNTLDQTFSTQIQVTPLIAWSLLLLSILFSAFAPCWLLADVKAQFLTRYSWRFFIVSIMLIPFVVFEQRNTKNQDEIFIKQLVPQKLKPIFIGTINFCVWIICFIYACRFTSWNHAVCLSCLKFFILSAIKILKKQKLHQFQIAGTFLCALGVILVMSDSITLPQMFEPNVQRYKTLEPWKRFFIGDGLALMGSFVSVYLDQHFVVPQMPKFTYLYLYNFFLAVNLVTFGYFFGGSQFSFNTRFGIFGLFTYQNFVNVFYISVMFGFNLMVVNILIAQLFNKVIIKAGSCFQLIVVSIVLHVLGLESMPANMTCLGYSFITPGLIFIIGGQGALQNIGHQMSFQLYRPTQIRHSVTQSPGQMHSYSQQRDKTFESPWRQRTFDKLPFEMILEEQDQFDGKNKKSE